MCSFEEIKDGWAMVKNALGIHDPNKEPTDHEENVKKTDEEWVWVEGYKGTCSDMTCGGYQYEVGKRFDMPEDAEIVECKRGFHLCLKLHHVFGYYKIGGGHRFFRVKALVRKNDLDKYGSSIDVGYSYGLRSRHDKLVAKSIEFVSELTADEILFDREFEGWTKTEKKKALKECPAVVRHQRQLKPLIRLGYSYPFAEYIISKGKADVAMAVGSQDDLSMDMKVLAIMQM